MNDSTYAAVSTRLKTTTRLNVLHNKTRLFCKECAAMKSVRDVFPNRVATLECRHRRDVFFRTPEEVAAFEACPSQGTRRGGEMSELQGKFSPPKQKRFRGRSLSAQIQLAVNEVEALARVKKCDRDANYNSDTELAKARLAGLRLLVNHKGKTLKAENKTVKAELAAAKSEIEQLKKDLAARPATQQVSDESSKTEPVVATDDAVQKMLDAALNMAKRKPEAKHLSEAESTATPTPDLRPKREFSPSTDFPWRTPPPVSSVPSFRGPTPKEDIPSPVRNKVDATIEEVPRASVPEHKTVADIEADVAYAVDLNDRYAANQRLLEELREKQKEGR